MTLRKWVSGWFPSRGRSVTRQIDAKNARQTIESKIGSWVFRHRFAPGPERVIVCDVRIVVGGDNKHAFLRGNGRTWRVSWEVFAEHWRSWQGEPMPRPIVLGETLIWPNEHSGSTGETQNAPAEVGASSQR